MPVLAEFLLIFAAGLAGMFCVYAWLDGERNDAWIVADSDGVASWEDMRFARRTAVSVDDSQTSATGIPAVERSGGTVYADTTADDRVSPDTDATREPPDTDHIVIEDFVPGKDVIEIIIGDPPDTVTVQRVAGAEGQPDDALVSVDGDVVARIVGAGGLTNDDISVRVS